MKESLSTTDLIKSMWKKISSMNEQEQETLLKILLLNYYNYVTELAGEKHDILSGALSECTFVINYLICPSTRKIVNQASEKFDKIFINKIDA